ncbi:MAG: PHB depolymerase family esterase [Chloroflexota bacterium]
MSGCLASTMALTDTAGKYRTAEIHWPAPRTATRGRLALVVALHGRSGNGAAIAELTDFNERADAAGFAVLYPNALAENPVWRRESAWDLGLGSDTDAIVAFIEQAVAAGCVDNRRVYATGYSLGGGMAAVLGCRRPDLFAAIAPVAGIYGSEWLGECMPSEPVGIIAFHGTADTVLHYEGGLIDAEGFTEKPTVPVPQWAAEWANRNGCQTSASEQPIGSDVVERRWSGCDAPVELYAIQEGGHTWPGSASNEPALGYSTQTISATQLMWSFFEATARFVD